MHMYMLHGHLTYMWKDKAVHTFLKSICPKVNVIARLEYELAYCDSAVHRFNHYTTRTPFVIWARGNKSMFFKIVFILASRTCNLFFLFLFYFLVSVINHYHINGLHLFGDSFEWFCLQIKKDAKYFFLSCPRHCDRGLKVVIVNYFQIWIKKRIQHYYE